MDDGYDMGEFGDLADYGELHPLWGFVGGGALTGAAMTTAKALQHHFPSWGKYAGLLGGGVGLLGSGILMIPRSTRRAGYLGAVAALLVALPEILRALILQPRGLGDDEEYGYTTAEFAAPEVPALQIMQPPLPLGVPMAPPVHVLQAPNMGYTTAEFAGAGTW